MHRHVADFFAGHEVGDERWADTPSMRQRLPAFRVIRVAPGPRSPLCRLDHGHTVPIGEPWLPGSACDHLLVSLPYPFGPELEMCRWDGGHARLLWLLPITEAERDFRTEHDLRDRQQPQQARVAAVPAAHLQLGSEQIGQAPEQVVAGEPGQPTARRSAPL